MLKEFKLRVIEPAVELLQSATSQRALEATRTLHGLSLSRLDEPSTSFTTLCIADAHGLVGAVQVEVNSLWTARLTGLVLMDRAKATPVLEFLMVQIEDYCRARDVRELWVVAEPTSWLSPYWADLHFAKCNNLVTMEADVEEVQRRIVATNRTYQLVPGNAELLDGIVTIDHNAFTAPWQYSAAMVTSLMVDDSDITVCLDQAKPAGYCAVLKKRDGVHLTRIAVAPEFVRRGVASVLMASVCDHLHGGLHITLNTPADALPAMRLYRKLGFVALPENLSVFRCAF